MHKVEPKQHSLRTRPKIQVDSRFRFDIHLNKSYRSPRAQDQSDFERFAGDSATAESQFYTNNFSNFDRPADHMVTQNQLNKLETKA